MGDNQPSTQVSQTGAQTHGTMQYSFNFVHSGAENIDMNQLLVSLRAQNRWVIDLREGTIKSQADLKKFCVYLKENQNLCRLSIQDDVRMPSCEMGGKVVPWQYLVQAALTDGKHPHPNLYEVNLPDGYGLKGKLGDLTKDNYGAIEHLFSQISNNEVVETKALTARAAGLLEACRNQKSGMRTCDRNELDKLFEAKEIGIPVDTERQSCSR